MKGSPSVIVKRNNESGTKPPLFDSEPHATNLPFAISALDSFIIGHETTLNGSFRNSFVRSALRRRLARACVRARTNKQTNKLICKSNCKKALCLHSSFFKGQISAEKTNLWSRCERCTSFDHFLKIIRCSFTAVKEMRVELVLLFIHRVYRRLTSDIAVLLSFYFQLPLRCRERL